MIQGTKRDNAISGHVHIPLILNIVHFLKLLEVRANSVEFGTKWLLQPVDECAPRFTVSTNLSKMTIVPHPYTVDSRYEAL